MKKLVFDADALIKLAKAGVLDRMKHEIMISGQVHNEAVVEGKKLQHHDAEKIDWLVDRKVILVRPAGRVLRHARLGKGELSTVALFICQNHIFS